MTDPLIEQARTVNDAIAHKAKLAALEDEIDVKLAVRKALRNEPHKRGWITRRGTA